jgi:hypothetical protein
MYFNNLNSLGYFEAKIPLLLESLQHLKTTNLVNNYIPLSVVNQNNTTNNKVFFYFSNPVKLFLQKTNLNLGTNDKYKYNGSILTEGFSYCHNWTEFIRNLENNTSSMGFYLFVQNKIKIPVIVSPYRISDINGKTLFCFASKVNNYQRNYLHSGIDSCKNLEKVLFISKELLSDRYKNLYKRIEKEIIKELFFYNIPIVIVNNIDEILDTPLKTIDYNNSQEIKNEIDDLINTLENDEEDVIDRVLLENKNKIFKIREAEDTPLF